MPLSPEEIAAAEKLHRFVLECECRRSRWLCLTIFCCSAFLAVICFKTGWQDHPLSPFLFGIFLCVLLGTVVGQLVRRARYQQSAVLLRILEHSHPELPWIQQEQEEAHLLDAARELEKEMARGHAT